MKQITTKPYNRTARSLRSTRKRPLSVRDVGAFVRELTKFHERGALSKEQYQRLVLLAGSVYVGQEVEKRVGKVLEEALSPERLAHYLSPSH